MKMRLLVPIIFRSLLKIKLFPNIGVDLENPEKWMCDDCPKKNILFWE